MNKSLLLIAGMLLIFTFVGCGEEELISELGDTVSVHYTGKLLSGEVFDSSEGKEPIAVNLGGGEVIPGFENGLVGMKIGEKKSINISPEEGYGPKRDDLIGNIPREMIPETVNLIVGEKLQSSGPNGQVIRATIIEITDDSVKVDMNFELAGQTLVFEVEMVEISKAEK